MISPQVKQQCTRTLLQNIYNSVIDRILVLFQPTGDIVGHDTGIVGDGKVGILKYKECENEIK